MNYSTDRALLLELAELAEAIKPQTFSKYQQLLSRMKALGVTCQPDSPRLLIFSERLATLKFLQENLCRELGVSDEVVRQFHAGLPDTEQQHIVESFGKEDSPIRILLASDVASEGVNLPLLLPPADPFRHPLVTDYPGAAQRPYRPLRPI